MSEPIVPKLDAPGAGVPWWQRLAGKYVLVPVYGFRLSWDGAVDRFERQGRRLIAMAEGHDAARLEERVLVPPQIGLEDSSRFYSYAMVLEHLTITGGDIAKVVFALTHSQVPPGEVKTENLKASGGIPVGEAVAGYESMLREFRRLTIDEAGDRNTPLRYTHPWFGALGALQWMRFAPFHQTLHTIQVRRILANP